MKRSSKVVDGTARENKKPKTEQQKQPKKRSSGHKQYGGGGRYTLFVGQLPYDCTKETLVQHFAAYSVRSVRLVTDKKTKKFRGVAFVEVADENALELALKKNGSKIGKARPLVALVAKSALPN